MAKAKLLETEVTLVEKQRQLKRCQELSKKKLCAPQEMDTTSAAYRRAKAAHASAKAKVAQAEGVLNVDENNLKIAVIRSPIDGVVLSRSVEPGQTVAASFQTPVLFTLAEDLRQMNLHVDIDEADVGQVTEGQQAEFTVDAYPERRFPARLTQVRFAPQTVDGVVTYETLLAVDNSDLVLRPGMTATAVITVQNLSDVILLPNAALRFIPPADNNEQRSRRGIFGTLFPRPPMTSRRSNQARDGGQQVWVLKQGEPVALKVKTGASDGRFTRLIEGQLAPGDEVIVDTAGKPQ
jgi:HlyD family secretion protein